MGVFTAIVIIAAIVIGTEFVLRVVKMGTRYSENIERIKRGYPTLDGAMPMGGNEDTMPGAEPHVHGGRLQ